MKVNLLQLIDTKNFLKVTLVGDAAFYTPNELSETTGKTGLGSSAALVSSLVAGLFAHLVDKTLSHMSFAHDVAQFVHCLAQGKVGSGFDVSSSFYGPQVYNRFDPDAFTFLFNVMLFNFCLLI